MNDKIENSMISEVNLRFCRLCGKHRPPGEFTTIQLSKLGNVVIKYEGCKNCSTVIHNATVMISETAKRFLEEQKSKIILPGQK